MAKASQLTSEADDDLPIDALKGAKLQKRWVQEIDFYESKSRSWYEKGRKILRRYKDDRSPRDQRVPRFNILWSNTETLGPACYSNKPKPDIERRFRDKDAVGRFASQVLERSITYFVNEAYDACMQQAVKDYLLPGRGTVWVRYEPHFKDVMPDEPEEVQDDGLQITDDVEKDADEQLPNQEIADEVVCWDYVHWEDMGHCFGRTFEEVPAWWRKAYLTRSQLIERFPECGEKIILDYSPHDLKDNKYDEVEKKATIYEIWDKDDKKVYWIHKDYITGPLDVKDDPLNLTDFFPFPMPLYATLGNDSMIPVPDYIEYQDQAHELDELTSRIGAITKAVKVAGVYDASAAGVERVLAEGVENQLVPVSQYAVLSEKGGMKGVIDLLPMQDILATLLGLYEARDKVKADLYEITGIADVIRGNSDPDETATAQELKGKFGSMRLDARQSKVRNFARDLVKIGTEIIAEHFQIETIKKISGVKLFTQQEKMMVQASQQQAPAPMGHNGGPPMAPQAPMPLPPEIAKLDPEDLEELMLNPTWEEVEALLKNESLLSYRIDIETDSTIKVDQDSERTARIEFLQATSAFMDKAIQVPPEMAPLAAKMLQFGIRGFKVGKELESAFEVAIAKLEKKAQEPPQPSKEDKQMQADMALEQFKSQQEQARLQMQAAVDKNQAQLDFQLEQHKADVNGQIEMAKAKMDNETKIIVAQIAAKTSLQTSAMSASQPSADGQPGKKVDSASAEQAVGVDHINLDTVAQGPSTNDLLQTVSQQLMQTFSGVQQSLQAHAAAVTKPRQVVRNEHGDIVGVQ